MLVPVGTIAKFRDAVLGGGEFIYLPGVASTILGSTVSYQISDGVSLNGTTALWAGTASNTGYPIAVATAAIVAAHLGLVSDRRVCDRGNTSGTIAAGNGAVRGRPRASVQAAAVNGKNVTGVQAFSANGVPDHQSGDRYYLQRPAVEGQTS